MHAPARICKALHSSTVFAAAVLTFAFPLSSEGRGGMGQWVPSPPVKVQPTCTFEDGSTMTFGSGKSASAETWHAGDYDATTWHLSEAMVIPPMNNPLHVPAGNYTLFVADKGQPPWTLIISKKTGEWGMSYPGQQYDLGRTGMGFDTNQPVDKFTIGCTQSPILVRMQVGRFSALLKILAVSSNGEYHVR